MFTTVTDLNGNDHLINSAHIICVGPVKNGIQNVFINGGAFGADGRLEITEAEGTTLIAALTAP